jgi:hypothetical protein
MTNSPVPRLARELERHLNDLEDEVRCVRGALHALRGDQKNPSRKRRGLRQRLLAALAASPGSRASVLALELNLEVEDVKVELRHLSNARLVHAEGMGWRLSSP